MNTPIYACLWSKDQAKTMATYYCGIFKEGKIISENPFVVHFHINGTLFMALNGNKDKVFSPATSFVVECDTQEEIDHYWESLGRNGVYNRCGWLDDQFGVSWQIVPKILSTLMADPNKAPKVMEAFLKMDKFEIDKLLQA